MGGEASEAEELQPLLVQNTAHWISGEFCCRAAKASRLSPRHVQFFASPTDLLQAHSLARPKLVLAIPPTMSYGPSRWLFTALAGADGNVVILTGRSESGTLTRDLYDRWANGQSDEAKWGGGATGRLEPLYGKMTIEVSLPLRFGICRQCD